MPRATKPNPYNGFKDDRERRIALNTKARWSGAATVVAAYVATRPNWHEEVLWLLSLFH